MRAIPLSILSLALLAGAASAAEQCPPPSAKQELTDAQARALEGAYKLSDGRILRLTQSGSSLYAEITQPGPTRPSAPDPVRLVVTGPQALASADGKVSITYLPEDPVSSLKLRN